MLRYLACLLLIVTNLSQAQVRYTLTYTDSSQAKVFVRIQPATPLPTPVELVMPRSIPGAYNILKYDYFIEQPKATGTNGKVYAMQKNVNDAPRFLCVDSGILISSISYEVDLQKMERLLPTPTDASIIRPGFAGLLNYSVFGWIDGTEKQPVECIIETFASWPVFSTLAPLAKPLTGSMQFATDNYYTLADGQTFIGPAFRVKEYKAAVPLFVAGYSQGSAEYLDDYAWQEATSMEILKEYIGELPFKHYSLMLRCAVPPGSNHSGGLAMEHLASSTFFNDTSGLRRGPLTEPEKWQTLPTYLHHMAHAYIPLRCYGDAYRPQVMEIPPVINNIWFNEGFMWYIVYDTLKLPRMLMAFETHTYRTSPIIRKLSLQQLSQTASTQYGEDFRLGRATYSRGALLAKEINDYVEQQTKGKKSIKDIYRYLYQWSLKNKRGFTLEEFPSLLQAATGVDVMAIYKKWQAPIE